MSFFPGFVTDEDDEDMEEDLEEETELALLCPQCSGPFPSTDSLRDHLEQDHGVDPKELPDILVGQQQRREEEKRRAATGGKSLQQVVSKKKIIFDI